ncbi:MAG TPA: glutamate--tRNA ligase, partial [Coleofasciculaceae cyanobacterium]
EQLAALIGPSLARLDEAIPMTRYLFVSEVGFTEEAMKKLHQPGSGDALKAILNEIEQMPTLTETSAQDVIKQVAKDLNRKEGQLKPLLRVALTGETRGPDLIQSWLLLHQRGWDRSRLQRAIEQAA